MNRVILRTLLSHWRRRPLQLVTFLAGLALATALWSGVQAINAEARKAYDEAAATFAGASEIRRVDGARIDMETYARMRRDGWKVSPVIEGWLDADRGRVRLLGVDPFTLPTGGTGSEALAGAGAGFLDADGRLLAAPATAERLAGLRHRLVVVDGLAPSLVISDLASAATILDTPAGFDRLILDPKKPPGRTPLDVIAPDLRLSDRDDAADLARLTDSFHLNLTAFGLLSFAVGLFIVTGAVGLAFEQRRQSFRTLRALGVTARRLVLLLSIELLGLALAAGAFGIALGYVIAAILLPGVSATLGGLYGASVPGTLSLSPFWWLGGGVVAVLGTAVAAIGPLHRAAKLPVLAAAKPRAWALSWRHAARRQLVGAAAVLAATGLGYVVLDGLLSGFVLLGGLLLASALMLSPVLDAFLHIAERHAKRATVVWFWADTRQQLPGLSLALTALLLALSASIGVGTMVQSFRTTFTGWLDQRLAAEVYVASASESEVAPLLAFLGPRVEAILPIWRTDTEIFGAPAEVFSITDHATYRDAWPLLDATPDVWARVSEGGAALVNEQLARREGLSPGDVIDLSGGPLEIAGVYSDYGNPLAQVMIAPEQLAARFPDADKRRFALRVPPGYAPELTRELVDDFGLDPSDVTDQASIKRLSLEIFERTFRVTDALRVLTLAVAAFALLTSLLTLSSMRLPQLAPLWALGLTRRDLGKIEVLRAIMLALLTFVLALPVGHMLAWTLLAVVNVEAFGWRLPMYLFPLDWLLLGLLSLIAAALASLWPAMSLVRRPPAELVAVFAQER